MQEVQRQASYEPRSCRVALEDSAPRIAAEFEAAGRHGRPCCGDPEVHMIGMYWDFGDEPPGISATRHLNCFYRTAIAADGEEVREKVTNIRCDRLTCVARGTSSGRRPTASRS